MKPDDPRTPIERALESIPPEIRFRVPREGVVHRDLKPENPDPDPVAPVAVQRSLFEMEEHNV